MQKSLRIERRAGRWLRSARRFHGQNGWWFAISLAIAITWSSTLIAKIAAGDIGIQYTGESILLAWYAAVGVWFVRVVWSLQFRFTIPLIAALTALVALGLTVPYAAMALVSVAIIFDFPIRSEATRRVFPIARLLQIPTGMTMLTVLLYGIIHNYTV